MQWLQDQVQCNVDNLNNVGFKASKHLGNKEREYLKSKVNEPEIDNKNRNIRDLYVGINN
jgi:ribonuclease HII